VLDITDLADRGLAAHVDSAQLATRHANHGVVAFLREQLGGRAGGADELAAAAERELDVVDRRADRDVGQWERIADAHRRLFPTLDRVADLQAERGEDGQLYVNRPNDERRAKELHGLSRTLISNMVVGVTDGYRKSLEIAGTGYRVQAKGSDLEFALGFSHPVVVTPPPGITFTVERPTLFHIAGIDKQLVGEVAANIRKIRPPEPYKGKGVKYQGEVIRRKAGKAGKK